MREKPAALTRIEVQRRTRLTQKPIQKLFAQRIFDLQIVRNAVKRSMEVVATEESVERFNLVPLPVAGSTHSM